MEIKNIEIKKIDKIKWLVIIKIQDNHILPFIVSMTTRKGKKYDVYVYIKKEHNFKYLLSFGSAIHQHFYDKFGAYNELNHDDLIRKDNYYKRFGSHNNDILSAKFWSHEFLW